MSVDDKALPGKKGAAAAAPPFLQVLGISYVNVHVRG